MLQAITQLAKDGLNALEKKIEENYEAPQEYRSDVPAWNYNIQ